MRATEKCDHDYPERDGRCVGCGKAVSGDALRIEKLEHALRMCVGFLREVHQETGGGRFTDRANWSGRSAVCIKAGWEALPHPEED